jgi:hypothetical protein
MNQHQNRYTLSQKEQHKSLAQRPGLFYGIVLGATGAFLPPATAAVGLPQPPTTNPINNTGIAIVPARTGPGVYTLTPAQPLPLSEYKYDVGLVAGPANSNVNVAINFVTGVITVTVNVAAVATDNSFWIEIEPVSG